MSIGSIFEKQLAELLLGGTEECLREFVLLVGPLIYSYLNRIGVSSVDRDDLYQEILIKVITNKDQFDSCKRIGPWIFTVAVNLTRSRFRAKKSYYSINDIEEPVSTSPDSFDKLIGKELIRRIEDILPLLPLAQREAVLICGFEQIEQKQAAIILNVPEATLRTNLRRARIKLAEVLLKLESEDQLRIML